MDSHGWKLNDQREKKEPRTSIGEYRFGLVTKKKKKKKREQKIYCEKLKTKKIQQKKRLFLATVFDYLIVCGIAKLLSLWPTVLVLR